MRYRFPRFPDGKLKAVTFSYDDGFKQDIKLADILNRLGLKGTFNLCGDFIRNHGDEYLSREEVEQHLLAPGHEIAVHGDRHRVAGVCSPVEFTRDLLDGKQYLEQTFGRIVRGMAYSHTGVDSFANGNSYERIRQILVDCGIAYSRKIGTTSEFNLPDDWYYWTPNINDGAFTVKPDTDGNYKFLLDADRFLALSEENCRYGRANPRVFYVYGHSSTLDSYGLFEKFEMLCERLAGHDDVWYATNIEIHDYIEAYHALEFSADGALCHNPTMHKIWFVVDEKPYVIESGQTIQLD